MDKEIRILAKDTVYDGYFQIVKIRYQHTLFNGGWSQPLERELFERGRVVAVLPYDPDIDSVLLIEQCRTGALNSEYSPWLIEVIAGIIEPGESTEEVVRRESIEEAGCVLDELKLIAKFFVTPGGSSELASLYFAVCDLKNVGGIHGLAEEGEDIRTHIVKRQKAFEMLENGEFNSTKVIMALQWFALNYQRLFGSS
jgi:ADP-ribose pyrophosphatase